MLETLVFRKYRYSDNIDEEISKKREELKKDINNVELLQQLAEIYHAYKKNDEAITVYKKIVELSPNNYEMFAYLGYLYYEENQLTNAELYLTKSLEIHPLEPFVLFLLGNVLSRKGNVIEAINYYELAVFLDFDLYTAHIDFGRKYEHMGRHKRALEEYKMAYDIDNTDEDLLNQIEYVKEKIK